MTQLAVIDDRKYCENSFVFHFVPFRASDFSYFSSPLVAFLIETF